MQLEDSRSGEELQVEDSRGEEDQLEVEPVVCASQYIWTLAGEGMIILQ